MILWNRKLLNLVIFFVDCDRFFYLSLKLIKFLRLNKITLVDFVEYMILNLIALVECDWKIRCWISRHFAFHTMSVLTFTLTVLFSMVLFNWHFLLLSYLQEQERSRQYQKQLEDIKSQINKSGNKSAVCVDLSCQGRADLSYQMYMLQLIFGFS